MHIAITWRLRVRLGLGLGLVLGLSLSLWVILQIGFDESVRDKISVM